MRRNEDLRRANVCCTLDFLGHSAWRLLGGVASCSAHSPHILNNSHSTWEFSNGLTAAIRHSLAASFSSCYFGGGGVSLHTLTSIEEGEDDDVLRRGRRNEKRAISRVDESSWTIQYIKAGLHALRFDIKIFHRVQQICQNSPSTSFLFFFYLRCLFDNVSLMQYAWALADRYGPFNLSTQTAQALNPQPVLQRGSEARRRQSNHPRPLEGVVSGPRCGHADCWRRKVCAVLWTRELVPSCCSQTFREAAARRRADRSRSLRRSFQSLLLTTSIHQDLQPLSSSRPLERLGERRRTLKHQKHLRELIWHRKNTHTVNSPLCYLSSLMSQSLFSSGPLTQILKMAQNVD